MSDVVTGPAKFGNSQYGIVTRDDMTRLVMWAIGFAKATSTTGNEGYEVRRMVRKLIPLLSPTDLIALADLADSCSDAWKAIASEMREAANKPLFKQ